MIHKSLTDPTRKQRSISEILGSTDIKEADNVRSEPNQTLELEHQKERRENEEYVLNPVLTEPQFKTSELDALYNQPFQIPEYEEPAIFTDAQGNIIGGEFSKMTYEALKELEEEENLSPFLTAEVQKELALRISSDVLNDGFLEQTGLVTDKSKTFRLEKSKELIERDFFDDMLTGVGEGVTLNFYNYSKNKAEELVNEIERLEETTFQPNVKQRLQFQIQNDIHSNLSAGHTVGELLGFIAPNMAAIKITHKALSLMDIPVKYLSTGGSLGQTVMRNAVETLPADLISSYNNAFVMEETSDGQLVEVFSDGVFLQNIAFNLGLGATVGTLIEALPMAVKKTMVERLQEVQPTKEDLAKFFMEALNKELPHNVRKRIDMDNTITKNTRKTVEKPVNVGALTKEQAEDLSFEATFQNLRENTDAFREATRLNRRVGEKTFYFPSHRATKFPEVAVDLRKAWIRYLRSKGDHSFKTARVLDRTTEAGEDFFIKQTEIPIQVKIKENDNWKLLKNNFTTALRFFRDTPIYSHVVDLVAGKVKGQHNFNRVRVLLEESRKFGYKANKHNKTFNEDLNYILGNIYANYRKAEELLIKNEDKIDEIVARYPDGFLDWVIMLRREFEIVRQKQVNNMLVEYLDRFHKRSKRTTDAVVVQEYIRTNKSLPIGTLFNDFKRLYEILTRNKTFQSEDFWEAEKIKFDAIQTEIEDIKNWGKKEASLEVTESVDIPSRVKLGKVNQRLKSSAVKSLEDSAQSLKDSAQTQKLLSGPKQVQEEMFNYIPGAELGSYKIFLVTKKGNTVLARANSIPDAEDKLKKLIENKELPDNARLVITPEISPTYFPVNGTLNSALYDKLIQNSQIALAKMAKKYKPDGIDLMFEHNKKEFFENFLGGFSRNTSPRNIRFFKKSQGIMEGEEELVKMFSTYFRQAYMGVETHLPILRINSGLAKLDKVHSDRVELMMDNIKGKASFEEKLVQDFVNKKYLEATENTWAKTFWAHAARVEAPVTRFTSGAKGLTSLFLLGFRYSVGFIQGLSNLASGIPYLPKGSMIQTLDILKHSKSEKFESFLKSNEWVLAMMESQYLPMIGQHVSVHRSGLRLVLEEIRTVGVKSFTFADAPTRKFFAAAIHKNGLKAGKNKEEIARDVFEFNVLTQNLYDPINYPKPYHSATASWILQYMPWAHNMTEYLIDGLRKGNRSRYAQYFGLITLFGGPKAAWYATLLLPVLEAAGIPSEDFMREAYTSMTEWTEDEDLKEAIRRSYYGLVGLTANVDPTNNIIYSVQGLPTSPALLNIMGEYGRAVKNLILTDAPFEVATDALKQVTLTRMLAARNFGNVLEAMENKGYVMSDDLFQYEKEFRIEGPLEYIATAGGATTIPKDQSRFIEGYVVKQTEKRKEMLKTVAVLTVRHLAENRGKMSKEYQDYINSFATQNFIDPSASIANLWTNSTKDVKDRVLTTRMRETLIYDITRMLESGSIVLD